MATTSSFTSRFPEAKFRDAIRNTMKMGMPPEVGDQLAWFWKRTKTYEAQDQSATPYNLDATPVTNEPGNTAIPDADPTVDQRLYVDYALEFSARPAGSTSTVLGEIDTSRGTVTLFDVDFEKVKTADYAMIGDTTYRIQLSAPTIGLFGVAMQTIVLEAVDVATNQAPDA